MAAAVGGGSVWVYNHLDRTVSEIDARTAELQRTTDVSARPVDLGLLTGPVLAADEGGAWIIGVDGNSRPVLTRVLSGARGAHDYLLDREPRAVAIGAGAVWVLGAGARAHQVLRVDPATGEVTARTRFPASSRVTSLDVGLGAVWAVSSSSGTLYRINPRSAAVTRRTYLGQPAGRPEVQFGAVWVSVADAGGGTLLVDPRTLSVVGQLSCCAPATQDDVDMFGSIWSSDWPSGRVVRWDGTTYQVVDTIAVTEPPLYDGLCLTSIAAGAEAVWVTLASSVNHACTR
jgi:DNA-binding beta-propeller fold protein YncE